MRKKLWFWTNVTLIASAHVAIVFGLIRWSSASKDADAQSVTWLNGGGGDGIAFANRNSPAPRKESRTEPPKAREADEERPVLTSAPSDIQLPIATATPVLTPLPRSTSTSKPSASPKIKGTPKPKPRPTRRPTPKPTASPRKLVLAKASPKPTPQAAPEKEEKEPAEGPVEKKEIAKQESPEIETKKSTATQTGSGKGTTAGSGGGRAGGSANAGQFAWYGSMLHDRFYSEWVQPTNVASAGAKNSVLVKLRIEKDGKISNFEIARPSGNAELDESVKALANRVGQVEPVPEGLGKGDHYDVKINFELNSE
jgi:TonB family protein